MNQTHFQTIIVGVDFSPYSNVVVSQALLLSKRHQATLVFVHTLNSTAFTSGEIPYIDLDREFFGPLTQEIVSFYKLKKIAPKAKVIVNLGRASDGIVSAAREFPNPLIVVGHKGTGTLMGKFFIGSTAEQLALHSEFPVWIHRGNITKLPNKILLPCDFSKRATESLEIVKYINGTSKSKYEFFHATHQPVPVLDADQWKKARRDLIKRENNRQEEFQRQYPDIPVKSKVGEPAPLIAKESKKFDLIAIAPHNRKGIFSGFGSVTAKVVRSGNTPILITH